MSRKVESRNGALPTEPARAGSGSAARWGAIAILVLGTAFFLYASFSGGPPPPTAQERAAAVADHGHADDASRPDPGQKEKFRYFEDPAEAHPLPITLPPSQFRNAGIANSYRVAKEIPEVLAQQPCLCGCDNTSDDHRSLLDCFIDEHASTCLVCMKEAVLAEQMTKEKKPARDIREAILRHEYSKVSIGN